VTIAVSRSAVPPRCGEPARTSWIANATFDHPADSGVMSSNVPGPSAGRIGPDRVVLVM